MNMIDKIERGNGEPVADREVIITRVFDAPARLLFLAYSTPEHIRRWFGPKGWPLTKAEMDFRVGGQYHFQMTGPESAMSPPLGGTYLEIVPDRKIVYDNGFELPHSPRFLVAVTFDEQDGRTTLTIRTVFDSVETKELFVGQGFVGGTNSGLDNLEDVLREWQAKEPG
jgi:uncharacterized protein YndB with AHSA1/START domain